MPSIVIFMFLAFFAFVIFSGVNTYLKNEKSPIVATRAQVVDRRRRTNTHNDANGHMHTDETFYLIFGLDTGSTLELRVRRSVYKQAPSGEWGTLTFQGTRFLRFESPSGVWEK